MAETCARSTQFGALKLIAVVGTILAATLTAAQAAASGPAASVSISVIPRPLHVDASSDAAVRLTAGSAISTPPGDGEAADVARYLAAMTLRLSGLELVPRTATTVAAGQAAIVLRRAAMAEPEGYRVDIGDARVTITAPTRAGLFYGAITVAQLLSASARTGPVTLAPMHIVDAPRFAWRGLMLDSARHFQSPAFIERMLDWMALHKLNTLQWHLTDDQGWRLEIAKYPRLTSVGAWRTEPDGSRYGGFYTQAQVRHLVAYAAARNITIVPEIEMPGHALAAVRAYPQLGFAGVPASAQADWGIFPSILSPSEATFGMLGDILGEVMALFPSRFIAVGGDEAVKDLWHGSPAVQARMRALGLAGETALQGYFVRRIGTMLNAHGRRLIGWDEILESGGLPASDAVLSWHGVDGAIAAARAGHDVVMATAPTLYFDNRQTALPGELPGRGVTISLHDVYSFDPGNPPLPAGPADAVRKPGPLTDADRHHIIGLQGQLWTEHIATETRVEAMALPRAAAIAESGWTAAANRDWPDFVARLPAQFARYRALGLNADTGAFAVRAAVRPAPAPDTARVALSNQLDTGEIHYGEIRYTLDGSEPTASAARYDRALDLALPVRLRAAALFGGQRVAPETDRQLDAVSIRRRISQELKLCSERVPLNLEGKASGGGFAPRYLVDIMNPCWIYPPTDLTAVRSLSAGVGALPFRYQLGAELATIKLRPPATPAGELEVRRDTCDGPVIAVLPLGPARRDSSVTTVSATLPPQTGAHALCLSFTGRQLNPFWALAWVQLMPSDAVTGR